MLGLTMALGTLSQFVLGALGPRIIGDLAIGRATFGLAVTALFAAGLVLAPIAGGVVDRVGGRRSLVGVCVAAAVAMGGLALATSVWWFALVAVGGGVAMALANPATNRVVRACSSRQQRGTVVGVTQAGVQAGALAAGLLAAASGWLGGWRGVAWLLVAVGLAGVALVLWVLPPLPHRLTAETDHGAGAWTRVLTRPSVPTATVACYAVLMGAGSGAVFSHLPLYAFGDVGLGEAAAGAIPAVFGVVGMLARVQIGRSADRGPGAVPLLVAMGVGAAAAAALLALAATAGPAALWVGVVLFGMTGVAWPAVAMLTVVRAAPAGRVGAATGWVATGLFAGLLLTPAAAGWAAEVGPGYPAVWWTLVGSHLAAAAVARWGLPAAIRRTAT